VHTRGSLPWIRCYSLGVTLAAIAACQAAPLRPSTQPPATTVPLVAPGPPAYPAATATKAVNLHALPDLAAIVPQLAEDRVVFVGEIHTDYAAHLNQLAIIQGMFERHPDLAIGMEYFQQPFQIYLDAYVAGRMTDTELLAKTQYFQRWGYDFRLYEPILKYAREHHIPLVALNVPSELVRKVGEAGFAGLTEQERAAIPDHMDRSNPAYRAFLESVFKEHPNPKGTPFEHFYDVQLLWDEGMAARAASYLEAHPARTMVVLAGIGHVQYGFGIPDRLSRRIPVRRRIVLNEPGGSFPPGVADFMLLYKAVHLPSAGTLGVTLEPAAGRVRIASFAENSAARAAGLEGGDQILSLNGERTRDLADVKLVMWNKRPGDRMRVRVGRSSWFSATKELTVDVTLR
jgi:uncharacterized iron-regulated protein